MILQGDCGRGGMAAFRVVLLLVVAATEEDIAATAVDVVVVEVEVYALLENLMGGTGERGGDGGMEPPERLIPVVL